ncbi:MAG: tetratricopeptide repeat protein [Candidatus Cloacimonetes bacterium]|nr:tetratricopeptide repeat protein [Candidatus Cloacimonadota bacterium]
MPIENEKVTQILEYLKNNFSNDLHKSLEKGKLGLSICKNVSNEAKLYYYIAKAHSKLNNFSDAFKNYIISTDLYSKNNNKQEEAAVNITIAYCLNHEGKYSDAIEYYIKALNYFEKTNKNMIISKIMVNLGAIYYMINQYSKALYYYQFALSFRKKLNDEIGLMNIYNNLGNTHFSLEDLEKAKLYHLDSLKLAKKLNIENSIARSYNNLALVYTKQNNQEKALEYLKLSHKLMKKNNNVWGIANTANNMGDIFLNYGDYESAKTLFTEGLKTALELNDKLLLKDSYFGLFNLNYSKKNYQTALDFHIKLTEIKDSILNEDSASKIAKLEAKYEFDKKEKEAEIYRLKNIDLNEKIESEVKKRQEQQEKIYKQSQLAVLGELASGIAHEINQPLQSLSFTLENIKLTLNEGVAEPEYIKNKVDLMIQDSNRMQQISNHIRIFSRDQKNDYKIGFCINESIQKAVDMIHEQFENHNIIIKLKLSTELPQVLGNMYRFEQVVLNLLSNSKDSLEEKWEEVSGSDKRININTYCEKKQVILNFSDNGTGIKKEFQEKIFLPFFTTKEAGKGTGLGLSISYTIINEMDGKIEIVDLEKEGLNLKISLPNYDGKGEFCQS